jgi:nucleoside-diphosphate-sugar epimerase
VQLVARRIPLPLASIKNQRSLIYVGNLVSALLTCADHPLAAGKTYLVSDGSAVSTPELIRAIATSLGIRATLWPAPRWALLAAATLLQRRDDMIRLTESLVVDDTPIRHDLAWTPPFTMESGLAETARWLHGKGA